MWFAMYTSEFQSYIKNSYKIYVDGFYREFSDNDITFLTFDQWKVFYDADSEGWQFSDEHNCSIHPFDCFPYYIYVKDGGNVYKVIKFSTMREYKKFYKFFKNKISHVLDGTENQQEILELSQIIGEKAKKNLEEAQRKVQEQYRKTYGLMNNNGNVDNIQEYFSKKLYQNVFSDSMCINKVPYKIRIDKDVLTYFNDGTANNPTFIKLVPVKYCISGRPVYLKKGTYHVAQEKFFEGYTYCLISGMPNTWIRICDIAYKEEI